MHRTQKYRAEAAKHTASAEARPSIETGPVHGRYRGPGFATRKTALTQEQLRELTDNLAAELGDFA